MQDPTYILAAEHFGTAEAKDGKLNIGDLEVPYRDQRADIYIRRSSKDLSVMEIHIACHDGLSQEELDRQNDEAEYHPLGPKDYWRTRMVGKYVNGHDGSLMTDEDFEEFWAEGDAGDER